MQPEEFGHYLDKDPLKIYFHEQLRWFAAANLILIAYESYHYSYLYENLERYKAFDKMTMEERTKPEVIFPVVIPYLNCCYTICTVFENYMKAMLLYRNVIVHTFLPHPDLKKHFNKQKTNPYRLEEGSTLEGIKTNFNPKFTIGFKTLMSRNYQSGIKLPEPLLKYLEYIVKLRNSLHFQTSIKYSSQFTSGLDMVHKFITEDIRKLIDSTTNRQISIFEGPKQ